MLITVRRQQRHSGRVGCLILAARGYLVTAPSCSASFSAFSPGPGPCSPTLPTARRDDRLWLKAQMHCVFRKIPWQIILARDVVGFGRARFCSLHRKSKFAILAIISRRRVAADMSPRKARLEAYTGGEAQMMPKHVAQSALWSNFKPNGCA